MQNWIDEESIAFKNELKSEFIFNGWDVIPSTEEEKKNYSNKLRFCVSEIE